MSFLFVSEVLWHVQSHVSNFGEEKIGSYRSATAVHEQHADLLGFNCSWITINEKMANGDLKFLQNILCVSFSQDWKSLTKKKESCVSCSKIFSLHWVAKLCLLRFLNFAFCSTEVSERHLCAVGSKRNTWEKSFSWKKPWYARTHRWSKPHAIELARHFLCVWNSFVQGKVLNWSSLLWS